MNKGPDHIPPLKNLLHAYRLRWKRREMLWRAIRARHKLTPRADRTAMIRPGHILVFLTQRNEMLRLPGFLDHYRTLGINHFLIVDHGSDDGSAAYLAEQPDLSLWQTSGSYHDARFGMDWLGWLLARHGHGHWCLTVDADELLIYPWHETRNLHALTAWLEGRQIPAMGALMLDLFPKGRLSHPMAPGAEALDHLCWFDPGPFRTQIQQPRRNRWVQGGPRERAFFAADPARAPTLNKLPLIRWNRRYCYINSTHSLLPRRLNDRYDGPGDPRLSGALLHTKFLPDILARSAEEKARAQHFNRPQDFDAYYDALIADPNLWHSGALRLTGWQQLANLGLIGTGGWG